MKGNALPARRKKKRPRDAFIGLRQVRGSLSLLRFRRIPVFFEVNRINYNYYDHHSPSVSSCYVNRRWH